jgi:hypothetical protein
MRQELTLEQQDQQMQDRLEMAQFFARRESETRLQFVARVSAMMLRCTEQDMWCGDELFVSGSLADELEQLVFELEQ